MSTLSVQTSSSPRGRTTTVGQAYTPRRGFFSSFSPRGGTLKRGEVAVELEETDFTPQSGQLRTTTVDLTAPYKPNKASILRFTSSLLMLVTVILYFGSLWGHYWAVPINNLANNMPRCQVGLWEACGCYGGTRNTGECYKLERRTRFQNNEDEDFSRASNRIIISQLFAILSLLASLAALVWGVWSRFVSLTVQDTYKLFLGVESVVWLMGITAVCGLVTYCTWEAIPDLVERRAELEIVIGTDARKYFTGTIIACVATVVAHFEVNPKAEMTGEKLTDFS